MDRVFKTVSDVGQYVDMVADQVVGRRILQLQIDGGQLDPISADLAALWLQGEVARLSRNALDELDVARLERGRLVARADKLEAEVAAARARLRRTFIFSIFASIVAAASLCMHLVAG